MMDVKAYAAERGLMGKDLIAVVRTRYRGYGKSEHSKVAHPDKYGIRLLDSAEKLIIDAFDGTAPAPRRAENRRNPCRVQCRLSKTQYEQLQLALTRSGETMQGFVSRIIAEHLGKEGDEDVSIRQM